MKKIIKISIWIITIFLGLILLIGIFTQTPLFRTWLKNIAVSEVNSILQAELSIEEIDGNIFGDLTIFNIFLLNNDDTLLVIPELHLSYNLLSLLNRHINIHQIFIDRPLVHVSEDSSGTWSFDKLISKSTTPDTITKENETPFGYIISVDSLILRDATANIETVNTIIPKKVSQLDLNLNARYSAEEVQINLQNLAFETEQPFFKMHQLGFNFSQSEEGLWLRNLIIITGENQFDSEVKYHQIKNNYFNLTSENLNLHEFEFLLSEFKLKIKPDITITSKYDQDSLEFQIGIQNDEEYISINGNGENFLALFDSSSSEKINFKIDLKMKNLRLQNWIDDYPETLISGQFGIKGSYTKSDDLEANMNGILNDFKFEKYQIDSIQFKAAYAQHNLIGDIHLLSNYTNLYLQLNINDLLEKPHYKSTLSVSHFDLSGIIASDSRKSDLNFNLVLQGENFFPPDNFTSIELDMHKSQIYDFTIDTLSTAIQLHGSRYSIEKFQLSTLAGFLSLTGSGDLQSYHRINYQLEIGDLRYIAEILETNSLAAKGTISGLMSGKPESFTNDMDIDLTQLKYNDIKIDTLVGNTVTTNVDSGMTMTIDLLSQNMNIGNLRIDKVNLRSNYVNEQFMSEIDIGFNSDLKSSLTTILRPDSLLYLSIPRLEVEIIGEKWNGKLDNLIYDTGNNELEITALDLKCITIDDSSRLSAAGKLSFTGQEDFKVHLQGIRPKTILTYLGMDGNFDGPINFDFALRGTADIPVFEGGLHVGEGVLSSIKYKGINSLFNYENDRLNYNIALNFNGKDSLTSIGYFPLHFSLTDTLDIFNPAESIDLEIKSEGIPVGLFFSNPKMFPEISGTLLCDFTLKNTLSDPTIRGNLHLKNGALRSPYWGIDYNNIELNISAFDNKFSLEKFQIFTTKGKINASGEIQLDYNRPKKKIVFSNLRILADKFYLLEHKDFEIQISSDIKYQMEQGKPILSGYVDVNKSSFYLPTIMDRAGYITTESEETKPALVKARNRNLGIMDIQKKPSIIKSGTDTLQAPGFLEVLEGEIELRISRNTWIRNPQLRLELGGNLNMRMKDGDFFLKGPVDIVRGQYDLLGRRFTVIEGYINFQGSKEFKPPIYLEAEYIYRTVGREKRALVLKVTGNIEYPIVTFLDSNNEISQDDAIAIILYGRKTDELSFGSQSDVTNESNVNTAAMGIVSNIVSNQLSRSVGDNLQLDVIEVNATDNWQSANFIVGKYITQDIFVTYKREFGQSMDNNLYPETISMEYEIQKYLFLQLIQGSPQISGYDFLFKYDWD